MMKTMIKAEQRQSLEKSLPNVRHKVLRDRLHPSSLRQCIEGNVMTSFSLTDSFGLSQELTDGFHEDVLFTVGDSCVCGTIALDDCKT